METLEKEIKTQAKRSAERINVLVGTLSASERTCMILDFHSPHPNTWKDFIPTTVPRKTEITLRYSIVPSNNIQQKEANEK